VRPPYFFRTSLQTEQTTGCFKMPYHHLLPCRVDEPRTMLNDYRGAASRQVESYEIPPQTVNNLFKPVVKDVVRELTSENPSVIMCLSLRSRIRTRSYWKNETRP
jgi:hypothetical protein